MKVKFIAMAIASAALAVSCAQQAGEKVPALNPDNLDTSVAPGVDFYQYATGGWQKTILCAPSSLATARSTSSRRTMK